MTTMSIPEMFDLSGRVAIVTGGTRGIGFVIAQALAEAGAAVVPTSRTKDDVYRAVESIRHLGSKSLAHPTDVTTEEDVVDLFESTHDRFDGIDILVNNAGINPGEALGRPEAVATDARKMVLDVNLHGAFNCIAAAGDYLHNSDGGVVVNVASVGGIVGLPRQHPYVASKHGLVGLTKSLALDWAPDIRVNAIAPGYVTTELTSELRDDDELRDSILRRTPIDRFADPEEIAGPTLFLASDAASYCTGMCMAIDGGWTAQ